MLFHEALARSLVANGVDVVFGVLGDANLYAFESFSRLDGTRYYPTAHEAGAVLAANGYARTSGKVGAATVTHGPGLTNTITALVESAKDHTPLVLVVGDTPVVDKDNFQSVPQREVVLSSGAGFEPVRAPETVFEDVATAVRRAQVESRPVVLNVPVEFNFLESEFKERPQPAVAKQAVGPDPAVVSDAVGIIAYAKRPVILAGQGACDERSKAALVRLAERIGAPVATSLRAKDLFLAHPYNLGIFGTLSNPVALAVMYESDCVVAFGASLNRWTTASGSLLANKRVVHVDLERRNLNQFSSATLAIVGDAASAAEAIMTGLDQAEAPPSTFANPDLARRLEGFTYADFEDLSTDHTVDIRSALLRLEEVFPKERTFVLDGGRFAVNCFTMLHVPEPAAFVHTLNYLSIGLGMGNAIGAYFGAPDRPVLMVCGDGGFMLGGLVEFNTAVRLGVDLVVVVFNDGAYGAEHIRLRDRGIETRITTFKWPELAGVATALGGAGYTVRNLDDLDRALAAIERRQCPVLLDVKLDPDSPILKII